MSNPPYARETHADTASPPLHKAGDSDMVVQSGVDWMEINSTLKEKGIPLFFPVGFIPTLQHGPAHSEDS